MSGSGDKKLTPLKSNINSKQTVNLYLERERLTKSSKTNDSDRKWTMQKFDSDNNDRNNDDQVFAHQMA